MCHDITVRSAVPGSDPYGNPVRTYEPGTVYRGRAWMTAGRVEEKYRETSVETWWVILPPEALVGPHDRIEHAGRSYDVEEVMPRLGHSTVHHLTVRMTLVEGFS
jgi:hypothetical protein